MKFAKTAFFLLILSLISGFFINIPKYIKINRISCSNQFGSCSSDIQKVINKTEKANLNLIEAKKELEAFLINNILVTDFSFQFKLPSTLQIHLLERKPKFALKKKQNAAFALVDNQGVVVSYQDTTLLPVLIIDDIPPDVGETVSRQILSALEILSDMFFLYQTKNGNLENESLVIELKGGLKVIFPLETDREILLGSLRLILGKLNKENNVTTIDLRYKNPILR